MPKKSSVYLKDWTIRLLEEENLSFNNDLIDALIKKNYLPGAWGNLESSFLRFYSSDPTDSDIRPLLAAIADVASLPNYATEPHLEESEEVQVLRMLGDFLISCDWSQTYDYGLSSDYDPEKFQRWLYDLAACYDIVVHEIDLYKKFASKMESVGLAYSPVSGFQLQENDVCQYELYKTTGKEIKDLLNEHLPPYKYWRVIIQNWKFYRRFEGKLQPQLEYCILCSTKPEWTPAMLCRLRRYLTYLSKKYINQTEFRSLSMMATSDEVMCSRTVSSQKAGEAE